MTAELINVTNITGRDFVGMALGINEASGQVLFMSIVFLIYIIMFIAMSNKGVKVALLSTSFIMSITSSFLWFGGFISGFVIMIFVIMTIFGILGLYLFDN